MKTSTKELLHYLECGDLDNLILKGHILTEHALDNYIEKNSIQKLDENKFSYSDKIDIAQILGLFRNRPWLRNELALLNKLRNSIAHNLIYNKDYLASLLKSIIGRKIVGAEFCETEEEVIIYENDRKKLKINGEHMNLMLGISNICGAIEGTVVKGKP